MIRSCVHLAVHLSDLDVGPTGQPPGAPSASAPIVERATSVSRSAPFGIVLALCISIATTTTRLHPTQPNSDNNLLRFPFAFRLLPGTPVNKRTLPG